MPLKGVSCPGNLPPASLSLLFGYHVLFVMMLLSCHSPKNNRTGTDNNEPGTMSQNKPFFLKMQFLSIFFNHSGKIANTRVFKDSDNITLSNVENFPQDQKKKEKTMMSVLRTSV